jgi:hypothetical protein
MQPAREARPPRARRLTAALLAVTTLLLAGGITVYGPAQPAAAAPVEIDNPLEIVPITDSVWPFDGHANPFEEVTVQVLSGGGVGCTDVADAAGAWSCNVTFTETNEFTLVQAISFDHTTPDQIEDTQEYAVTVPPTVTATPQTPGIIVSNQNVNPAFSGLASPNADIDGPSAACRATPPRTAAANTPVRRSACSAPMATTRSPSARSPPGASTRTIGPPTGWRSTDSTP